MPQIDATILTKAEAQTFARMRSFSPRQLFGTGLLIGVGIFVVLYLLTNAGFMWQTVVDVKQSNNDLYMIGSYVVALGIGFALALVMTKPASPQKIERELARIHYKERLADRDRVQGEQSDLQVAAWKDQIATWLLAEYPDLQLERANATLAQSRYCALALPIDFVYRQLGLAIQANSEKWNDRQAYEEDVEFETYASSSMHLCQCCAKHGITLVHVWDSMSMDQVKQAIKEAVDECEGYVAD